MRRVRFSERHGYTAAPLARLEFLSDDTRMRLLNAVRLELADDISTLRQGRSRRDSAVVRLWDEHWKLPVAHLDHATFCAQLDHFMLKEPWFSVLDDIELVVEQRGPLFANKVNGVLEQENCAYRVIAGITTTVVSEEQVAAVAEAADGDSPSAQHMRAALESFSDRESPNFANAVKDAVAAVEAEVRVFSGREKANLGEALKRCRDTLPRALYRMIEGLWGYSSEVGGARHAIPEDGAPIERADAQLAIITCSALVTWFRAHEAPAGSSSDTE